DTGFFLCYIRSSRRKKGESGVPVIAITGIDGSGKTTFARELKQHLVSQGVNAIRLDIPHFSTTPFLGWGVRLLVSFFGYRRVENVGYRSLLIVAFILSVLPLVGLIQFLARKRTLIVEHYPKIDLVPYASVYGGRIGRFFGRALSTLFPSPSLVVFLDASPETSRIRIVRRNNTIAPHETLARLKTLSWGIRTELLRNGFEQLVVDTTTESRVFVIDTIASRLSHS
ncbi:MAG: adenylyl-sulfate kinase, partial [Candidatus Wildermuthbacteria bacterium]|nr:adenylyl-sulfate kinase [Candidatus Wildermuthbacteria bacterium]